MPTRGIAGATVTQRSKGTAAAAGCIPAGLELSENLPVRIEIVDMAERIEPLLAALEPMIGEGLVTVSTVHILRFLPDPKSSADRRLSLRESSASGRHFRGEKGDRQAFRNRNYLILQPLHLDILHTHGGRAGHHPRLQAAGPYGQLDLGKQAFLLARRDRLPQRYRAVAKLHLAGLLQGLEAHLQVVSAGGRHVDFPMAQALGAPIGVVAAPILPGEQHRVLVRCAQEDSRRHRVIAPDVTSVNQAS